MSSKPASSAEFVPRTAPLWALVGVVTNYLVLDTASRSRRARAWMRFGAVSMWFVVIVMSGSSRWIWAVPWVVTVGLTVPHGYRNDLKRYRTGWRRFDQFVGWLLPDYGITPWFNPVGILDGVGSVLGGLVTGQLFGTALDAVHAFRTEAPRQVIAGAAAYVLAAVGLAGGAAIVTTHFSWQHVDVAADRKYQRTWLGLTIFLTVVIFGLLWPGSVSSAGYGVRLILDIGAALAVAFICVYGRLGASRRITETDRLVTLVKKRVREVDSVPVHNMKHVAVTVALELEKRGLHEPAGQVTILALELEDLQKRLQYNHDVEPRSLTAIFRARVETGGAKPSWTGVVADLEPETIEPKDAEFIEAAADGLISNAMGQDAKDLELSLTARPRQPIGGVISLEATCTCGVIFDGTGLSADSSLRRLAEMVREYRGEFTVEEYGGGRHACRLVWTTLNEPIAMR